MIVTTTVSAEVKIDEIYALCRPINRNKCLKEIRNIVKSQLELRSSSDDGWQYPFANFIAGNLIDSGYAVKIDE